MKEIHRRLYHIIAGAIIPVLYFFLSKGIITVLTLIATIIIVSFELFRLKNKNFNKKITKSFSSLMKKREKKQLSGTSYFIISCLLTILIFEKNIAILAMLFLVFGDAAATSIGKKIGKTKVINNKSLEGSLACFITCIIVGFLVNLGFTHTTIIWGALAATIIELIPIRIGKIYIDDNLTIALVSALVMYLV